jgi:hypothetical protein
MSLNCALISKACPMVLLLWLAQAESAWQEHSLHLPADKELNPLFCPKKASTHPVA